MSQDANIAIYTFFDYIPFSNFDTGTLVPCKGLWSTVVKILVC